MHPIHHLRTENDFEIRFAPVDARAIFQLFQAMLDLAEALEQLGEARNAISLLSKAESEYPSSRAVRFRLLHLYRSIGEKPKAVAEGDWFKSHPG